jgi:hypothetical protein
MLLLAVKLDLRVQLLQITVAMLVDLLMLAFTVFFPHRGHKYSSGRDLLTIFTTRFLLRPIPHSPLRFSIIR